MHPTSNHLLNLPWLIISWIMSHSHTHPLSHSLSLFTHSHANMKTLSIPDQWILGCVCQSLKKTCVFNFHLEFFTSHMEPCCSPSVECSLAVEQPLRRADSLSPHITLESLFVCARMLVCVHVFLHALPMCTYCGPVCVPDWALVSLWARVRVVSTCILATPCTFVLTSLFPLLGRQDAFQSKLSS